MSVRFEMGKSDHQTLFLQDEFIEKIKKPIKHAEAGKTIKLDKTRQKDFFRFRSFQIELKEEAGDVTLKGVISFYFH